MKTALVTGAAGFLGSHLCEDLIEQGFRVIGVDNFSTGSKDNLCGLFSKSELFQFVEADVVLSWDSWLSGVSAGWLDSLEYVFHFASPASPIHYKRLSLETMWVNSVGLGNALSLARAKNARVIFASTSEVYGDPQIHPQPESYWGNVNTVGERSCYDEAKRFGEALIYSENLKNKTRHGIVRIFNTFGPRMNPADGRVIINFLQQARDKQSLTVFGDGSQTRTFCFVSDLIAGVLAYAKSDLCEPVNIGGTEELSVLQVAQKINAIFMNDGAVSFSALSEDDPKRRKPDLNKALNLLAPWQPRVPFEHGLRQMADWLQS